MRAPRYLLPLLALLVVLEPGVTVSADPVSERLWRELDAVPWGTSYAQWRQIRSTATCREFTSSLGAYRADEEWCYKCTQQEDMYGLTWSFYVYGSGAAPVCRLGQFTAQATGVPLAGLEEMHRNLVTTITSRYGRGTDPGRDINEFGSAFWRDVVRWRTDRLEIYLYVADNPSEGTRLSLLVRHRPLVDMIAQDEQRHYSVGYLERSQQYAWALDRRLTEALRNRFPELVGLLEQLRAEESTGGQPPAVREQALSMIRRLLTAARTAGPEQQPVLLTAAARLAFFWDLSDDAPPWNQQREDLTKLGLTFEWSPLGATWVHAHDLLWRVWREHGATEWGERAFVLLLNFGWDTGVGCAKGSDQFREVIREGEAFLAARPASPFRLEVLFAVAQAYEAWWSLSRAADEPYVDPTQYSAGASAARLKAIRYYEQVVRLAPRSAEAAFAQRQLPRLKLGLATGQIRFFCVYD